MSVTIIPETGTGAADANTYVDPAGAYATAYFAGHLYATQWTAATDDRKAAAVIMATRVIESSVVWNGKRATSTQALGFPRHGFIYREEWIRPNIIPAELKNAVLEQALLLLRADRTSDAGAAAPVSAISLGKGALDLQLKASGATASAANPLSDFVASFLAPLIIARTDASGGTVKTVRT